MIHTFAYRGLKIIFAALLTPFAHSQFKSKRKNITEKYKGNMVIYYFHFPRTYSPPLFIQKVRTNKIYYLLLYLERKRVFSLEIELK